MLPATMAQAHTWRAMKGHATKVIPATHADRKAGRKQVANTRTMPQARKRTLRRDMVLKATLLKLMARKAMDLRLMRPLRAAMDRTDLRRTIPRTARRTACIAPWAACKPADLKVRGITASALTDIVPAPKAIMQATKVTAQAVPKAHVQEDRKVLRAADRTTWPKFRESSIA